MFFVILLLTIIGAETRVLAQSDTIGFNSGYDYATKTLQTIGQQDVSWKITSDPDSTTTDPRQAIVSDQFIWRFQNETAWVRPLPNSHWIANDSDGTQNINGVYVFDRIVTLDSSDSYHKLVMDLYADDWARVYLNDSLVGSTAHSNAYVNPVAHLVDSVQAHFRPGMNTLRVKVHNTGNVAMGVDIAGSIVSTPTLCSLLSVDAQKQGVGGQDCCYKLNLINRFQPNAIYSVGANVLTHGVKTISASGPWSPQPTRDSVSIVWSIPPPGLPMDTTKNLEACFTSPSSGLTAVELYWCDAAGATMCIDTVFLTCAPGNTCTEVTPSSFVCSDKDSTGKQHYTFSLGVVNNTGLPAELYVSSPEGDVEAPQVFQPGPSTVQGMFIDNPPTDSVICFSVQTKRGSKLLCQDSMCNIHLPKCQSGVEDERTEKAQSDIELITCYPDPASTTVKLSFHLKTNDNNISLRVSDALGCELVYPFRNGSFTAGNHSVDIDVSKFRTGIYFVTLISSHLSTTTSLRILR